MLSSWPKSHYGDSSNHIQPVSYTHLDVYKRQVVPHHPYLPDLALSDFHLFSALKDTLRDSRFNDTEKMKMQLGCGLQSLHRLFPKCFPEVDTKVVQM